MSCRRSLPQILALILAASFPIQPQSSVSQPLRAGEVMALVAGDALPEDIARQVGIRGLNFHLDDKLRLELKSAGAGGALIATLEKAKSVAEEKSAADDEILKRLSNAGKFLHHRDYDQAIAELDSALTNGYPGPETAFVMGAILVENGAAEEAVPVYQQILQRYPNFPDVHTKLSFAYYRAGDADQAYGEAEIALKEDSQNAEAHKNAGLALEGMDKHDAAIAEYREALKLKPDYQAALLDVGISEAGKHDYERSIETLKKSIALDPSDFYGHYNLGCVYGDTKQFELAIKEYRLAKQIDPKAFNARLNLANALMSVRDLPAAIAEYRQLEADYPDAPICRYCLASAERESGDLKSAEADYRKAVAADPSDPSPHRGVSYVMEARNDLDGALRELKLALALDQSSPDTHHDIARILLKMKRPKEALPEITIAIQNNPADWYNHGLYASILEADGQVPAALAEYRQAVTLDPSQYPVLIEYGSLLEKSGDWPDALEQFRKAAIADNISIDTQQRYAVEQKRFADYIASLKAAGKTAEADALQARVSQARSLTTLSDQMDEALQRGAQAFAEQNQADAFAAYKKAVEIGENMKPHDPRLLLAFQRYGLLQAGLKNGAAAEAIFERALAVTDEIYGPDSPQRSQPLGGLAAVAMQAGDFETALKYYGQILEINRKAFGDQSGEFSSALAAMAMPYIIQKKWDKAEPILLRSERIVESNVSSPDDYHLWTVISMLCQVYEGWGKSEQLLQWDKRFYDIQAKELGENNPRLADVLASEQKALTSLGRKKEAAELNQKVKALQAGAAKPGSEQ